VALILFVLFIAGTLPWGGTAAAPSANQTTSTGPPELSTPQTATPLVPLIGRLVYTRPPLAPNGEPWPAASGYLAGFEESRMNGSSVLTVDNRKTDSDMLVKLYVRLGPRPTAIRVLFLKQEIGSRWKVLRPGPTIFVIRI